MKKLFTTLLLAMAMGLSLNIFAQSQESIGMSPSVAISIGRNPKLPETFGLHNQWNVIARHCQDYSVVKHRLLHKLTLGLKFHALVPDEEACAADPSTKYFDFDGHNLVTNAGYDFAAAVLSGTSAQPAACNYFGFAIDSSAGGVGTIAITDTALDSSGTGSTELTGDMARNTSPRETYAHTATTLTYTIAKTYPITTTHTGINKIGVFNATSTGTMCFELKFTPVNVGNGDTLTPTLTNTMSNP